MLDDNYLKSLGKVCIGVSSFELFSMNTTISSLLGKTWQDFPSHGKAWQVLARLGDNFC